MIQVAVCGVGRTGSEVLRALLEHERFHLSAAFCSAGSEKAGRDVGELLYRGQAGIAVREITQIEQVMTETHADVLIDFSNAANHKAILRACKKSRTNVVFCTTGFSEADLLYMTDFVRHNKLGVVFAPNVTLGVNVLLAALRLVARALPSFDYHITETHHSKKYDIPSGTATKIASTLAEELPADADIPVDAIRAGGYVGMHTVLLASDYERLSLTHESFSRKAFVEGALTAAEFVANRIGWFEMEDVLGMRISAPHANSAVS